MQLLFNVFYKQYGIRRLPQLMNPRLFSLDAFSFPKNALYHHISHDGNDVAPDQAHPYFTSYKKRILMDVATTLVELKGNARRNSVQPQTLYRPYFMKNRLFKFAREPYKVIKDPATLMAIDYGYLQKLYRYAKMPLTPYYQWYNIEKTAWDNIRRLATESERQNFVFIKVPDVLPSLTSLRMYTDKINNVMLHVFDTPEKRFILELWRWINPDTREDSLLGGFTQEQMDKVNFILVHKDRWCVLNLGQFNQWRKEPKLNDAADEEEADKSKTPVSTVGYFPPQFQKLMLKLFMSIQSKAFVDIAEDIEEASTEVKTTEPEVEETDVENTVLTSHPAPTAEQPPAPIEIVPESKEDNNDPKLFEFDKMDFDELEKDLDALEFIEKKSLMAKDAFAKNAVTQDTPDEVVKKQINFVASEEEHQALRETIYAEKTIEDTLKSQIDKLAEYGLMSASDYRKLTKQAETFMSSPAPYAKHETIRDYVKIPQEALTIQSHEIKLPASATVPDKSMLESSLAVFDSKYIKNVMPKDITAMVMMVQKAGIVIQDYEIEKEHSALGAFEIHTLKVKPIDGAASTLRFKIPVVDEEGRLKINGNTYHLRKQRGD